MFLQKGLLRCLLLIRTENTQAEFWNFPWLDTGPAYSMCPIAGDLQGRDRSQIELLRASPAGHELTRISFKSRKLQFKPGSPL